MADLSKAKYRKLAEELARDSIVTQCLARFIEQIIEEIHTSKIEPLTARIKELEEKCNQPLEAPLTDVQRAIRSGTFSVGPKP